ncbi:MAG TPA: hypothetical protein VJT15_25625 [Pyrinomonadaceae bacterium]|nr:hypothetical protein [Pyrinomonadaceae bacterium]
MTTPATATTEAAAKKFLANAVGTKQIGVTPAPAPELNGLLLQLPGAPQVYLVINGFRRWVPDTGTFNNLFVLGAKIVQDIGIGAVSEGDALSSGAMLIKGSSSVNIYLLSNGVKMWIPSPTIFQINQFNSAAVLTLPQIVVDSIPSGPDIQPPTPIS